MRSTELTALLRGQASAWGGLALIGSAPEVSALQLQLLRELNRELVKLFLLGGVNDQALLSAFDALSLNAVRTEVLPVLSEKTCAAAFREMLAHVRQGGGGALLVGRDLGGHWPALLRRVPELGQGGITTVADLSLELNMPLPGAFRQFVVFEGQLSRFERAVARWHRHDAVKPTYQVEPAAEGQHYITATTPKLIWRGLRQ